MRYLAPAGILDLEWFAFVGCGPGGTPIPPGAQQVHVAVDGSGVHLEPVTLRAGDAYVVFD